MKGRERKKFDKSRDFRLRDFELRSFAFALVGFLRESVMCFIRFARQTATNSSNRFGSNGLNWSNSLARILNRFNYFQRNYVSTTYINTYTKF